jgi:hypothetical protein
MFLGTNELLGVPLDSVQGGVGRIAGMGGRGRRQRHIRLARLHHLHPPHSHQLHQLYTTRYKLVSEDSTQEYGII